MVKETQAEYTFRVEYQGETQHGQFFQLSVPKVGEAPISVSGKGNGYVEFTIRKIGRLTQGIFGLQSGDMLFMRGPYGKHFPVDHFKGKDLVVICGGTGMAPVKTTLNYFYDHPDEIKSVHLIAGFKDINCVLFTEELEKFTPSAPWTTPPPPALRSAWPPPTSARSLLPTLRTTTWPSWIPR